MEIFCLNIDNATNDDDKKNNNNNSGFGRYKLKEGLEYADNCMISPLLDIDKDLLISAGIFKDL